MGHPGDSPEGSQNTELHRTLWGGHGWKGDFAFAGAGFQICICCCVGSSLGEVYRGEGADFRDRGVGPLLMSWTGELASGAAANVRELFPVNSYFQSGGSWRTIAGDVHLDVAESVNGVGLLGDRVAAMLVPFKLPAALAAVDSDAVGIGTDIEVS